MKILTQLALVSAMSISVSAMAMESLDDEILSQATGQDGITLTIDTTGLTIGALYLHDNDGLDASRTIGSVSLGGTGSPSTTSSGAVTIEGLTLAKAAGSTGPLATVTIDADAGASGTAPFLNIGVALEATDITIDKIGVATSNTPQTISNTTTARRGVDATTQKEIIEDLGISLGASALNIQLGNQPQGALIVADATVVGGVKLSGLTLNDSAAGGSIVIGETWIKDSNSANLSASANIAVAPTGLQITSTGAAKDIYVQSLSLGTAQSIGSLEMQGLDLNTTTIMVSGH